MLSFILAVAVSGVCTAIAFAAVEHIDDPALRRTWFGRWVAVPLDVTWGWIRKVTGADWLSGKLAERAGRRSS